MTSGSPDKYSSYHFDFLLSLHLPQTGDPLEADCAIWRCYIRDPKRTNPYSIAQRSWLCRFVGLKDGPIPAVNLRPQALPYYLGYKVYLIKTNSLKILQEIEIIAPGVTNRTLCISDRRKEALCLVDASHIREWNPHRKPNIYSYYQQTWASSPSHLRWEWSLAPKHLHFILGQYPDCLPGRRSPQASQTLMLSSVVAITLTVYPGW